MINNKIMAETIGLNYEYSRNNPSGTEKDLQELQEECRISSSDFQNHYFKNIDVEKAKESLNNLILLIRNSKPNKQYDEPATFYTKQPNNKFTTALENFLSQFGEKVTVGPFHTWTSVINHIFEKYGISSYIPATGNQENSTISFRFGMLLELQDNLNSPESCDFIEDQAQFEASKEIESNLLYYTGLREEDGKIIGTHTLYNENIITNDISDLGENKDKFIADWNNILTNPQRKLEELIRIKGEEYIESSIKTIMNALRNLNNKNPEDFNKLDMEDLLQVGEIDYFDSGNELKTAHKIYANTGFLGNTLLLEHDTPLMFVDSEKCGEEFIRIFGPRIKEEFSKLQN